MSISDPSITDFGLLPQPYMRKRMPVTAFQFTGKNSDTIIQWLRELNIVAYPGAWVDEEEVLTIRVEMIGVLRKDDWVVNFGVSVNNGTGYVQVMNNENFERRFEKE